MNLEEMKALAAEIIQSGYDAGTPDDDVKMEMFTQKIPYSRLNGLFKSVSIELGLLVDPKLVTDSINELVTDVNWADLEGWEAFSAEIEAIADNVDGSTAARVLTLVRTFCRDEEIEVPKKPKASTGGGGSKGGKLAEALVALVNGNQNATKQEAYDAIKNLVGGNNKHKNVMYYVNSTFLTVLAVANGITVKAAADLTKDQADPSDQFGTVEAVEDYDDEEMAA